MTLPATSERDKHHRFPAEIVSHGVWLYYRFFLSYRDVEEWLCTRGVIVTYAVIQQWCRKFGQAYANQLRRRRPRPGDKWYLDEVLLTTKGVRHYLWFWRVRSHQRVGAQGLRRHSHLSWATQFVLHVTLSLSVLLCGGIQTPAQERLGVEPPQR